MPSTTEKMLARKEGQIGWMIFNQPEKLNAVSYAMWQAVPEIMGDFVADDEVRVVVVTGAGGKAFVSGADISEFGEQRTGVGAQQYDVDNGRAFGALSEISKPVIAVIHGFCVGGGCALSLTADIRYAADDAVFAIPAARLGLGYQSGGLEALVRTIGYPAAKELFFTGRRFDAGEALQMGLANRVYPKAELDAAARKIAEGIADNAPLTLRSAKLVLGQLARDPAQRDTDAMQRSIRDCYASADYAEGVAAFLAKRRPKFEGR
jgi:enoyl-CoA hydratase/carnithine racemase